MALTKTGWWGVVLDAPDGPEPARFYARLLETVRVMLDPAGHPFCPYLDSDDSAE